MRTILVLVLLACALSVGACSRTDSPEAAATPVPNLKSDAERLQQATSKAAEERKRAESMATATPTP